MPQLRRSAAKLRKIAQQALESNGQITNFSAGGAARTLIEVGISHMQEYYDALEFNEAMSRLSTSAGLYLDLLGEDRGVARAQAIAASVTAEDRVIRFYTKDGTTALSSVLASNKIATGTQVKNSDGSVIYVVTRDVPVDRQQVEVFVPAIASTKGSAANVGRNVLTSHSLGLGTIGVTNDRPVSSGINVESDENYRFRISRFMDRASGATAEAIRLSALAFPQVADVILRPFSDGVGSYEALVIPVGNEISSDTLLGIRAVLQDVTAFGNLVSVRAPDRIGVEIAVQLVYDIRALDGDKIRARSSARSAIIGYIASLPIGGTFVVNQMIQRVLASDALITDLKVLVFRFAGEPLPLRNVTIKEDELFTIDSSHPESVRAI